MTRPTWPRAGKHALVPRPDPAPALLSSIAAVIETRVPCVLRGRAKAICAQPERRDALPLRAGARAWRTETASGTEVWCVLSDEGAAGLLALVLGGPGAEKPTAMEMSIVRETVERLLSFDDHLWDEVPVESRLADIWLCDVIISSGAVRGADLWLIASAAAAPAPTPAQQVRLDPIPLILDASLPPMEMSIAAIRNWEAGAIVPLRTTPENTLVQLHAGRARIGMGILGVSRGRRAIMIGASSQEAAS